MLSIALGSILCLLTAQDNFPEVPSWWMLEYRINNAYEFPNLLEPVSSRHNPVRQAEALTVFIGDAEGYIANYERVLDRRRLIRSTEFVPDSQSKRHLSFLKGRLLPIFPALREMIHVNAAHIDDPKGLGMRLNVTEAKLMRLAVPSYGEARTPFRDVPALHWAAPAANDLRRLCLFRG